MQSRCISVLLIEDNPGDARLIKENLADSGITGFDVSWAGDLTSGLNMLGSRQYDVILLDLSLPESHGFETFNVLAEQAADIPVVVLTGNEDETLAAKAVRSGAQDYLLKDRIDGELLARSMLYAVERSQDIAERKRLEAQLRQSQRLEAVGTLASGIAHDFRNLLMGISGYAELLQIRLGCDHSQYSTVNDLLACVDKASKLVAQLLAFTRQQVLAPRPTDLNELVAESKAFMERLLGEYISIEWEISPDAGTVEVDPGQIEQVLVNLAVNAGDAMPDGGRLTISTGRKCLRTVDKAKSPWMKPGEYAVISVSDTGTGMDEATMEHIFEPFFTTKSAAKRSGLGLAVAYGIIKQHRGYISVESDLGIGTTFTVFLPVACGKVSHDPERSVRSLGTGCETILLAEDEDAVRSAVKMALEGLGYKVICACDGVEAVEEFRQRQREIDLVVLDLIMPGIGGKQVWQELSLMKPGLKALFMSGYSAASVHPDFSPPPGIPLLSKPFSIAELTQTIRSVLRG